MADETLLRDRVEIERQRDAFSRLDRINGVEKDVAIIKTLFDATIKSILEKLAGAVSDDDLIALKREVEAEMEKAILGVRQEIEKSNEAWAEKILVGQRTLNAEAQVQRNEEQKHFGRQIAVTVFAAALSVIGALFVFWMTSGRP